MYITKRYTNGSSYIKLYKYLLGVEKTRLLKLNDFLTLCRRGHVLISKDMFGNIIGGSLSYETNEHYVVAHCHINKEYRRTRLFSSYYAKIQTWMHKKEKPIHSSIPDIDGIERIVKKIHGKDMYEIDRTFSVKDL